MNFSSSSSANNTTNRPIMDEDELLIGEFLNNNSGNLGNIHYNDQAQQGIVNNGNYGGGITLRIRPQLIGSIQSQHQQSQPSVASHHIASQIFTRRRSSHNNSAGVHNLGSGGNIVHPRAFSPNSPLRNKIVYVLNCVSCSTILCTRAMRAILLADTKLELYSTDIPPESVHSLQHDSLTSGCQCRVRETACTGCGNYVGYQVSQPCDSCLSAKNNGHFWMFNSEAVSPQERKDPSGNGKPLYWASLTPMAENLPVILAGGSFDLQMPIR
jgi:hypothetical protein